MFEVETRNVDGQPTSIGSAGPFTLIFDRPVEGGGGGLGFNGGQLLYLAVAGCISNDLFREASAEGITLRRVRVKVRGEFSGDPAVSDEIEYDVEIDGDASADRLKALIEKVDRIAEIPNSLRAARLCASGLLISEATSIGGPGGAARQAIRASVIGRTKRCATHVLVAPGLLDITI